MHLHVHHIVWETWSTEPQGSKSKENYETYSCCKNHLIKIYFEFTL